MKKTIYIYHKSYNGAVHTYGPDTGKQISDDIKVFNTRYDAEEYACSFECVVDRKTFKKTSPLFCLIKEKEIEV